MHILTVDLAIANSCFQTKQYLEFLFFGWLTSCAVSLKSWYKWNSWNLLKLIACLPTVNIGVLTLQIYRPDRHIFSDQMINFNPFLAKIYRFERNEDVLFKFIRKEIFKLFTFSLRTNLVYKIYNLVCKISKRFIISIRCIEIYFSY